MKCKICGAELRKEGDICKDCYAEYMEEQNVKEELKSDKNVILRLHRKYIPGYQLTRFGDYYVLAIICILVFLVQKQILWFVLSLIGMIALLIAALAYAKRKAVNTTCTFYEDKIIWKEKDNIKSIKYDDLDNITCFQNRSQKRYDLGDVQFRPKKGIYLLNGFEIKNVPDFINTWQKICDVAIEKKEF